MRSLVPIPLYKVLETNYNDPYWYRLNNGLRTLEQATQVRDYYRRKDLPWYAAMDCTTAITGVSTTVNMSTGPFEDTIKAQVGTQERRKRDREDEQPSQGSPRPVTCKPIQVLKGRTANNGDKPAVQAGLEQYGFGHPAGGGTQRHQAHEGQQPWQEEEVNNRVSMPELTLPAALPATPVREGRAEGQESAGAPSLTISQDHL